MAAEIGAELLVGINLAMFIKEVWPVYVQLIIVAVSLTIPMFDVIGMAKEIRHDSRRGLYDLMNLRFACLWWTKQMDIIMVSGAFIMMLAGRTWVYWPLFLIAWVMNYNLVKTIAFVSTRGNWIRQYLWVWILRVTACAAFCWLLFGNKHTLIMAVLYVYIIYAVAITCLHPNPEKRSMVTELIDVDDALHVNFGGISQADSLYVSRFKLSLRQMLKENFAGSWQDLISRLMPIFILMICSAWLFSQVLRFEWLQRQGIFGAISTMTYLSIPFFQTPSDKGFCQLVTSTNQKFQAKISLSNNLNASAFVMMLTLMTVILIGWTDSWKMWLLFIIVAQANCVFGMWIFSKFKNQTLTGEINRLSLLGKVMYSVISVAMWEGVLWFVQI
jgi:hypothetical protein